MRIVGILRVLACCNETSTITTGAISRSGDIKASGDIQAGPANTQPSALQVAPPDEEHVFQLCGEIWKLRFRGEEVSIPHRPRSGLLYIRELIRNQGKHLFAVDVAAVMIAENRRGSVSAGDAVLDEQARLAYRKRYSDRKDELEEARRNNDEGRAISARNEMEQLEAQLRSSYGLGSRDRRISDDVKKAANRVSMAVRRAIKQVEGCSRPLAIHFQNSLEMGRCMSYRPEEDISWVC